MRIKCSMYTIVALSFLLVTLHFILVKQGSLLELHILGDSPCDVKFAPEHSLPPVALVSAPGSGNTWVRHLIEKSSGIYTGSIFRDPELYKGGFLGEYDEWDSGRVIVVKTHTKCYGQMKRYPAAILLIRNPYAAIISECNRMLTGENHTAYIEWSEENAQKPEFERILSDTINWYSNITLNWLKLYKRPLLVVHYEDLVQNTFVELEKILTFLNVTITDKRMECVEKDMNGHFQRDTNRDRVREYNVLVKKHGATIELNRINVSQLLLERGFTPIH
ncbi:sialate:O-sulfotransferase 1-like [Glandiceps talaboti]